MTGTIVCIVILLVNAWVSAVYIYHTKSSELKELIKLDREIGTSPTRAVTLWPGILPPVLNLAWHACMTVGSVVLIGYLLATSV